MGIMGADRVALGSLLLLAVSVLDGGMEMEVAIIADRGGKLTGQVVFLVISGLQL